jgi:hypothetical protein
MLRHVVQGERPMQICVRHHYEAKVDEVVGVMTDEADLRAKYRELGHGDLTEYGRVDHAGVTTISQVRTVRFPVPAGAAKLLVPEPVIRQHEVWEPEDLDGVRRGQVELSCRGLPVTGCASIEIAPDGSGGSVRTTSVTFHCDVPVIGGRIVAAVAAGAEELIEADHRANVRALQRRRR